MAKSSSKVITVPVHQVVSVSSIFLAESLHDLLHLHLGKVRVPEVQRLLVTELLAQLSRLTGADVEYTREGERMTSISVFSSIDFQTRVVDTNTHAGGVVVGPEHVINVQDDRLSGHVKDRSLLYLFS